MHHLTYFNFSTIEHRTQSVETIVAYTLRAPINSNKVTVIRSYNVHLLV